MDHSRNRVEQHTPSEGGKEAYSQADLQHAHDVMKRAIEGRGFNPQNDQDPKFWQALDRLLQKVQPGTQAKAFDIRLESLEEVAEATAAGRYPGDTALDTMTKNAAYLREHYSNVLGQLAQAQQSKGLGSDALQRLGYAYEHMQPEGVRSHGEQGREQEAQQKGSEPELEITRPIELKGSSPANRDVVSVLSNLSAEIPGEWAQAKDIGYWQQVQQELIVDPRIAGQAERINGVIGQIVVAIQRGQDNRVLSAHIRTLNSLIDRAIGSDVRGAEPTPSIQVESQRPTRRFGGQQAGDLPKTQILRPDQLGGGDQRLRDALSAGSARTSILQERLRTNEVVLQGDEKKETAEEEAERKADRVLEIFDRARNHKEYTLDEIKAALISLRGFEASLSREQRGALMRDLDEFSGMYLQIPAYEEVGRLMVGMANEIRMTVPQETAIPSWGDAQRVADNLRHLPDAADPMAWMNFYADLKGIANGWMHGIVDGQLPDMQRTLGELIQMMGDDPAYGEVVSDATKILDHVNRRMKERDTMLDQTG